MDLSTYPGSRFRFPSENDLAEILPHSTGNPPEVSTESINEVSCGSHPLTASGRIGTAAELTLVEVLLGATHAGGVPTGIFTGLSHEQFAGVATGALIALAFAVVFVDLLDFKRLRNGFDAYLANIDFLYWRQSSKLSGPSHGRSEQRSYPNKSQCPGNFHIEHLFNVFNESN